MTVSDRKFGRRDIPDLREIYAWKLFRDKRSHKSLPEYDVAGPFQLLLTVHEIGHVLPRLDLPPLVAVLGEGGVVPRLRFEHVVDTVRTHWHNHFGTGLRREFS